MYKVFFFSNVKIVFFFFLLHRESIYFIDWRDRREETRCYGLRYVFDLLASKKMYMRIGYGINSINSES